MHLVVVEVQMNLSSQHNNCGMSFLNGLSVDPKVTMIEFYEQYGIRSYKLELYMFSGAVHCGAAKNLATYIRENDLGECVESKHTNNPVHGYNIHAFLWSVNKPGLEKWWQENKPEKPEVAKPKPPKAPLNVGFVAGGRAELFIQQYEASRGRFR